MYILYKNSDSYVKTHLFLENISTSLHEVFGKL